MNNITEIIEIPNKIMWIVDLTQVKSLPQKIIQRLSKGNYDNGLQADVLDPKNIQTNFFPLYRRLIMDRADFRLDKSTTTQKIESLATNNEYKLLWFKTKNDINLGGIILHLLRDKMAVAYRCFDHDKAAYLGYREIDYYAETKMREYARSLKYDIVSHGLDRHPVTQVGLSAWKFRIGATPVESKVATNSNYSKSDLLKLISEGGVAGYYSDPVRSRYTKFHLFGNNKMELVEGFVKVANNGGVKVILHTDTE